MTDDGSLVSRAAKLISMQEQAKNAMPLLAGIIIADDDVHFERLDEGYWISGKFDRNIRIDQPTYGAGQRHAHILGRKGQEIGVVNLDGSASHGVRCRLSDADANALRAKGFSIRPGNIVEWITLPEQPTLIFG